MIPYPVSVPPSLFSVNFFSIGSPSKIIYRNFHSYLFLHHPNTFCLLTFQLYPLTNCINGLTHDLIFSNFKTKKSSIDQEPLHLLIRLSVRFNHCKFSNGDSGVISSI
ncbi:hypothetical protein CW304_03325 [Bacillus sp. UFRGS-B20]|nr:hypothetical protein CW304_03325 [Bacillus sp. UFRGS-B20]